MSQKKHIYFASDFHLGVPNRESSLIREKKLVSWLDSIQHNASEIYLMGDVFDFWFEYKHAIPKGFVRLQGKLAELTDSGIKITLFIGNHDMWIFDYLPKELGLILERKPVIRELLGKKFYLAHGDGLGPGDHGYKMIKKIFANPVCQWLFARIHPNLGIAMANFWSRKSRNMDKSFEKKFLGEDKEWLVIHAKEVLKQETVDFFIFGHRHVPIDITLEGTSRYINLGDWISNFSYAEFDGEKLELKYYK